MAAAAAFLERATMLTVDPVQRAVRALAAASAKIKAGAFDAARDSLSIAETLHLNDFQQARLELISAELALVTRRGSDAPPLLLKAARRLEPIDAELSRATYLQALSSGYFAGRLALGAGVREVARAALSVPPPLHPPRPPDLLLDGLVVQYNDGYAAGLPVLRKAIHAFGAGMPADEELGWPVLWPVMCGMTRAGMSSPTATFSLPAASERSASFRSPSIRVRSCYCSPAS
jgi:hypothetical protein